MTSCWESEIQRCQHELWNGQKAPCYRHTGPDPRVLASSLLSPSTLPVWHPHRPGTMFRVSTMTCVGLHRSQKNRALHGVIVMETFACKTHILPQQFNISALGCVSQSQGRVSLGASSSFLVTQRNTAICVLASLSRNADDSSRASESLRRAEVLSHPEMTPPSAKSRT